MPHSLIRSMDYTAHGAITGPLTDRKIDEYALKGSYGRSKQLEYFDRVRSGKLKSFDARIKRGEFGSEAAIALKGRKHRKKKVQPTEAELTAQVLADLGLEHLLGNE